MISLLTLLAGYVSPWIGDIVGYFQRKQDNAHELAMLVESNNAARDIANLDAQVGMAEASVKDTASARRAQPSYGAKLLDAVSQPDQGFLVTYIVRPFLLVMLTLIEVANGFMRPYAIYIILTLWASKKVATFWLAFAAQGANFEMTEAAALAVANALLDVWDEHDFLALEYALGFLLGSRHQLKREGNK